MNNAQLLRLSLVRFGASFMIVLTTGVFNRVFIAEWHYDERWFTLLLCLQQVATPLTLLTGYASDVWPLAGRHRVPHILLWAGASALSLFAFIELLLRVDDLPVPPAVVYLAAALAMLVFGLGVKASNLLVTALLVDRLSAMRRASALVLVWMLAILGLLVAGEVYSEVFDRFTEPTGEQLRMLTGITAAGTVVLALVGIWAVEPRAGAIVRAAPAYGFAAGLGAVLRNRAARWFFAALALAEFSFFCQDLILEVYGGRVFGQSIADTTQYNFHQALGTLVGMALLWSLMGTLAVQPRSWHLWVACLLGALSFAMLVGSALIGQAWLIVAGVLLMGVAKGVYNVALAGAILDLVDRRVAGLMLGVWGATAGLAIAAGMLGGGLLRSQFFDLAIRASITDPWATKLSFAAVFTLESMGLVLVAAMLYRFQLPGYRAQLEHDLASVFPASAMVGTATLSEQSHA
ncbi:MAG: PucC family protein [Pirellulales bacterium]